jgi:hypothetical protein
MPGRSLHRPRPGAIAARAPMARFPAELAEENTGMPQRYASRVRLALPALVGASLGTLLGGAAARAQPLQVYSEFARLDHDGHVIAPETPREILSPALARNAYTSFQVVVQAGEHMLWRLHVGQNPENAVRVTIYREIGAGLERGDLPVNGQGAQIFWMDLWVDRNAPVQRIKIEPALYMDGDWVTYPMEARIMDARVPDSANPQPLCSLPKPEGPNLMAAQQFRNAAQDGALAAQIPEAERNKLRAFCEAPLTESYFRIRDYLFRMR